jgi:hypothetical protein
MIAANSLASRFISRKLKSPQVRRHGPDDDIHTLCPSSGLQAEAMLVVTLARDLAQHKSQSA